MGIYTRYKRSPEGFRQLVELLESTPAARRQKLIDAGMAEDGEFTEKALRYIYSFQDIIDLPEPELAEVLTKANPRMIGLSVSQSAEDIQAKFLRCAPRKQQIEIRDYMEHKVSLREVGGAQMNLIATTRELERMGRVLTKKIPLSA